jgi:hypothetical protein
MSPISGLRALVALALLLASHGEAPACEGERVLWEDDFAVLDPSWGEANDQLSVRDGALVISPKAGFYFLQLSQANSYTDADICVKLRTMKTDDPTTSWASVAFWAEDHRNTYFLHVASNGYYQVARLTNGRWLYPVSWTETKLLNHGLAAWNDIRLTLQGREATVRINGSEVVKFKGLPPADGYLIGLSASSAKSAAAEFEFADLKITD